MKFRTVSCFFTDRIVWYQYSQTLTLSSVPTCPLYYFRNLATHKLCLPFPKSLINFSSVASYKSRHLYKFLVSQLVSWELEINQRQVQSLPSSTDFTPLSAHFQIGRIQPHLRSCRCLLVKSSSAKGTKECWSWREQTTGTGPTWTARAIPPSFHWIFAEDHTRWVLNQTCIITS